MAFSFDQVFAADPSNPSNVAQNAAITIFAPGDGTMTPLTITDPDGQPLANPITVNANGFASAFAHETLDRVAWAGGGFTGFFTSYEGMKQVALDAQTAAETAAATAGADAAAVATAAIGTATGEANTAADAATAAAADAAASATSAANAAALVGAPADTAIAAAVNNGASATRAAIDTTIAAATTGKLDKAGKASKVFTLAGLGDSITDGTSSSNDADRYTDTTWLHLTHALSMGKIVPGGNFGVGGDKIAQMLVRVPDVIASGATACLILGGTNDVPQSTTDDVLLAEVDKLFTLGHDVLAAAGIQPICATIPPRGRSTTPLSADHARRISKVNARIRRKAAQRGYPLVDFHKVLVDPANGQYWDAANNTSDLGVHPNNLYCRKMAEAAVAAISPMAGANVADLAGWNTDPTNLIPNGLFMGGTTTIGGYPMPTGWNGGTANIRAVTAPVAADNLLGNWFDLSKDATVAAATTGDVTALNPTIAAGSSTFAVGDRLKFSCRARIENFEGGASSSAAQHFFTLTLYLSGSNTNRAPVWQWQSNIADAAPVIEFTVPTGTTAISLQAALYGEGKLRIGQVTLRNLTALGIA